MKDWLKEEAIETIKGGLSNRVLLLDKGRILRIKSPYSDPLFYDPYTEIYACEKAHEIGLGAQIYDHDEDGNLLEEYLGGHPFDPKADSFRELGKALRKLHLIKIEPSVSRFDVISRVEAYSKGHGHELNNWEKKLLEQGMETLSKYEEALCHNDLIYSNIIVDGGIKLIDFEFAGINTVLFDIVSLLSENGPMDEAQEKEFLLGYFDNDLPEGIEEDILSVRILEDVLWKHWALYRFETSNNPEFAQIAMDKNEDLLKII